MNIESLNPLQVWRFQEFKDYEPYSYIVFPGDVFHYVLSYLNKILKNSELWTIYEQF